MIPVVGYFFPFPELRGLRGFRSQGLADFGKLADAAACAQARYIHHGRFSIAASIDVRVSLVFIADMSNRMTQLHFYVFYLHESRFLLST